MIKRKEMTDLTKLINTSNIIKTRNLKLTEGFNH